MKYSKSSLITEITKGILSMETLYTSKFVNLKGRAIDTKDRYSEIISSELLQCLGVFNKIPTVSRKDTYCVNSLDIISIDTKSHRKEEIFAKRMMGLDLGDLGEVIDFQVPLKDTKSDKGLGKVDLLACNKKTKKLFLIELKTGGNKDTLLKACLESYTHFKTIDTTKLISDCCNKLELEKSIDLSEYKLLPAVLVLPECTAYNELVELQYGLRPKLQALTLALEINLFSLEFNVCKI